MVVITGSCDNATGANLWLQRKIFAKIYSPRKENRRELNHVFEALVMQQCYKLYIRWSQLMPVSCRLPKIAARRFITPSERLLSISTLHQAQVEAYNGKLACCPVSERFIHGHRHDVQTVGFRDRPCELDKSNWLLHSSLQVESLSLTNSEMEEDVEQSEILLPQNKIPNHLPLNSNSKRTGLYISIFRKWHHGYLRISVCLCVHFLRYGSYYILQHNSPTCETRSH